MLRQKPTMDALMIGAGAVAVSFLTEKILLTPRKDIKIADDVTIPVSGLFALSQDYVAAMSKIALNTAVPIYARTMNRIFIRFKVREYARNTVCWLIYDFLGKYSLNTALNMILRHTKLGGEEQYKNVVSDLIQKYLNEKADRDVIIQNVTDEIVKILRMLSEGTLVALVFNDKFATALYGTIAAAVDRFIENEAATKITDFVFDITGHLEKMTIPNVLSSAFGITREVMESYVDLVYDLLLGDKMVQAFEQARFGDAVYDFIMSIDFNAVDRVLNTSMKKDVRALIFSSASSAVYFYQGATRFVIKNSLKIEKAKKLRNKMKNKFRKKSKNEFEIDLSELNKVTIAE